MQTSPWADYQRLPGLDDEGSQRLKTLIDQPHAPRFANRSGHHLEPVEVSALEAYTREEAGRTISAKAIDNDWVDEFIENCFKRVPFFRQYNQDCGSLAELPTVSRADMSRDITQFVPEHLPLDRLIAFETSGTTGHPLLVPSHPVVAARYSCYHKKALGWNGVSSEALQSELAVLLAGYQEKCFTYASISPYLNNKGLVKLNFHPNGWNHPDDRQKYVDGNKPDLISGDPISLIELSRLPFNHRPRAVLTTSMTLLAGCRRVLQQRFECPIIDLYSLNETGPIGCSVPGKNRFRLLQSRLLVEILDAQGAPVEPGERGEITVTGGFNDYLPLLRYRTGDYGRLELDVDGWFITELEGRPPTQFKTAAGKWLNNVDITHLLQRFPLSQFSLHQHEDGRLVLKIPPTPEADEISRALADKLGFPVALDEIEHASSDRKMTQYTSDLSRLS